jgi:hypothetical protein
MSRVSTKCAINPSESPTSCVSEPNQPDVFILSTNGKKKDQESFLILQTLIDSAF